MEQNKVMCFHSKFHACPDRTKAYAEARIQIAALLEIDNICFLFNNLCAFTSSLFMNRTDKSISKPSSKMDHRNDSMFFHKRLDPCLYESCSMKG